MTIGVSYDHGVTWQQEMCRCCLCQTTMLFWFVHRNVFLTLLFSFYFSIFASACFLRLRSSYGNYGFTATCVCTCIRMTNVLLTCAQYLDYLQLHHGVCRLLSCIWFLTTEPTTSLAVELFLLIYTVFQKNVTMFSMISWTRTARLQRFLALLLLRL